ncbi:hypothetical protein SUDANB126_03306 [Streptomyces sp. enrichment culture]
MFLDGSAGPECTDGSEGSGARPPDGAGAQARKEVAVIQYEWRGAWVVAAQGSYDMQSIKPLADALTTAAKEHPKVVLDASGITFADSSLLNLLALTHREAALRVAAPARQLQRVLELTGMDTVLEVRDTLEEAAA